MQLILAEFCGRWGCSWWENIITIILVSLKGKGVVLLLGLLVMPIFLVLLILLVGLMPAFELIASFGRDKQELQNLNNSQEQDQTIVSAGAKFVGRRGAKFLGRKLKEVNKQEDVNSQEQDQTIVSAGAKFLDRKTAKFLGRNGEKK
ncbi:MULTISPECIES: hypothetical protein [unclassified Microcoleus]|uniref:hypothetical protein n=1 Tax=unclassified Microcoleus TaxID=2642155 RepID=UPI002FD4B901